MALLLLTLAGLAEVIPRDFWAQVPLLTWGLGFAIPGLLAGIIDPVTMNSLEAPWGDNVRLGMVFLGCLLACYWGGQYLGETGTALAVIAIAIIALLIPESDE